MSEPLPGQESEGSPGTASSTDAPVSYHPTFKPITPPKITIPLPFPAEAQRALILASMSCFPDQWQVALVPLEKYSQSELRRKWDEFLLHAPPKDLPRFRAQDVPSCLPFDKDEDFVLLLALRHRTPFPEMMMSYGYVFKAFRSLHSIFERLQFLETLTPAQIDAFYESYASHILSEELAAFSLQGPDADARTFSQAICSFAPEFPIDPVPQVATEIGGFLTGLQGLAFCNEQLKKTALAVLRSERNQYIMRREAVMIGRGTIDRDVDIDLTFETDRTCTHISRMQAILAFLEDCNFYLENVGNRVFRVNGVVVEAGQICQVPAGALLDFSGTLLMFIPNETLVKDIRAAIDGTPSSSKKR
jgi:hypothetical protein